MQHALSFDVEEFFQVANLRAKVVRFDLVYFYDSVFTDPDRRKHFNTEEDLLQLDDWQLIKGCKGIGILSDIGFRHLDYIRDMRNWASAALNSSRPEARAMPTSAATSSPSSVVSSSVVPSA